MCIRDSPESGPLAAAPVAEAAARVADAERIGVVLRRPGAAGLVDELVTLDHQTVYWRGATNRFRGVAVILERVSGGLLATQALREEFAAQGWASLLVLVDPSILTREGLTQLLETVLAEARSRAGTQESDRVVLAATGHLAQWTVRVAPPLQVDGLLLRNLPGMMMPSASVVPDEAISAAGAAAIEGRSPIDEQAPAIAQATAIGPALLQLTQNVLLIQGQRPPWWVSRTNRPSTQEWQLTDPGGHSAKWLARRLRGWQHRLVETQ